MPKLSRSDMDARRQHILRAAAVCFDRRGFHRTTIADVRKQAGVSTGAIYVHFRNKDAIVRALLEQARDARRAQLAGVTPGGEGTAAQGLVMLEWIQTIFTPHGGHTARVDVNLWAEALRNPRAAKVAREALVAANRTVAEVVERAAAVTAAPRSAAHANAVAAVLVGLFLGLEVQAALELPLDRDRVPAVVADLLAKHFTAAQPPSSQRAGARRSQR